jgi:hypothetical protein
MNSALQWKVTKKRRNATAKLKHPLVAERYVRSSCIIARNSPSTVNSKTGDYDIYRGRYVGYGEHTKTVARTRWPFLFEEKLQFEESDEEAETPVGFSNSQ